jgi:hypothetical protein
MNETNPYNYRNMAVFPVAPPPFVAHSQEPDALPDGGLFVPFLQQMRFIRR